MNKTIHINLSGMLFQMEEDAHERLAQYLKHLEQKLGGNADAREVTADIEQRIAELLKTVCKTSDEVVTLKHINEIIETMGEPETIASDDADQSTHRGTGRDAEPVMIPRKFYRNGSNRILGGVCSGLAAYTRIDVTLMRVLWLIGLIFTVGTIVFWAYIILWIAIPRAVHMHEKMAMQGGFSFADKGAESGAGRVGFVANPPIGSSLMKVLRQIGMAIQKIAGFVLTTICGLMLLATLLVLMAGYTALGVELPNGVPVSELIALVIPSGVSGWALFGVGSLVVIPLLGLIYLGIRMMITFRAHLAAVWTVGTVLWFVAFSFSLKWGSDVARGFAVNAERTEYIPLQMPSLPVIHIKAIVPDTIPQHNEVQEMSNDKYAFMLNSENRQLLLMGKPSIRIEEGNVLSLRRITKAKGANLTEANRNRQRIAHQIFQADTVLNCHPYFQLGEKPLFRKQRIELVLTVPKGIRVEISPELTPLIED